MSEPIILQIYDLSGGMAASLSQSLIGEYYPAVYHTGVVVYGVEYFFGGDGISSCVMGQSPYGTPIESRTVAQTSMSRAEVLSILRRLRGDFPGNSYHFINHNCNNFSDAFIQALTNGAVRVPDEIVGQASRFMRTPIGQQFAPMIQSQFDNTTGMAADLDAPDTNEESDGRVYYSFTAINAQRNWTRLNSYGLTRELSAREEVAWSHTLPLLTNAGASAPARLTASDADACISSLAHILPGAGANTFVVIDMLRAIAASREGNSLLAGASCPPGLMIDAVINLAQEHSTPADLTMICRFAANMALHQPGREALAAVAGPAADLVMRAAVPDATELQQSAALALAANIAQCAASKLSPQQREGLSAVCVACMDANPEAAAVCMSLVE